MAFYLEYKEDGKLKREQFSSYYECIRRKEVLRNKGVKVVYKESGQDITRPDYTCRPNSRSSKKAIS